MESCAYKIMWNRCMIRSNWTSFESFALKLNIDDDDDDDHDDDDHDDGDAVMMMFLLMMIIWLI